MNEHALTTEGCQVASPLPGIISSGSINLLAGAPGVGKTALVASLARLFRDVEPIFGHPPGRLPGLGFVNADRGWADSAGYWFAQVGYGEVRYYSMADDLRFDPRTLRRKYERTARLFEFVDKLQLLPGSLVFCDPISLFLGGNLLDYDGCAVACHEMRALLRQRGLTLIGTAHSSKIKMDKRERYLRLQDQILGTTALYGFTDTQMYLASPEETGRPTYTFLWHPHTAPAECFDLERDERGFFRLASLATLTETNEDRVLALLPEDRTEIAFAQIVMRAQAIPLSRRTVVRALDTLQAEERVIRIRYGVYRRTVPVH